MDKLKAYEQLKKDLENGEITQKGFDNNIKKLLTAEKSDDTTSTCGNEFLSAAEAFGKAKKLLQPQVKKRQFPLNDKRLDHGKSLLKVRLAPMEWKPRTHRKCGRYQKLIMDEAPPRIILQGHETYDDLITIGKERFWPERTEGSEFTLCHSDGTRWSKQEFHKEYGTVSDITHMWKRTIYIGRRQLEVVCLDDQSSISDEDPVTKVGGDESCSLDELPETLIGQSVAEQDFHAETSSSAEFETGRVRKKSQSKQRKEENVGSSLGPGGAVSQDMLPHAVIESKEAMEGAEELSEGAGSSGLLIDFAQSFNPTPKSPSLYLPRVPYVEEALITYSEDNLLGEGTFGKVYRGSFHGTPAAVKRIMCGQQGMEDSDIHHEINVSLRLSHPNIVRLMAVARTESCFLLAAEYIHGATLQQVLHTDSCLVKLEGDDAGFISLDLSMAVEYIHAQRIIHQDIKPANVMVHHPSKKAVLTDWGMANIRDTVMLRQGSKFTAQATGPAGGTYLYMAPECILMFEEASFQTDMWSLGATYLEILTGSAPWMVKKQRELAALMATKTPPHALSHLSDKNSFLGDLVSYDPDSRPSASDVVKFLKSGLDLTSRYGYKW
ncbi:probable serine/threonine-protein kinase MARK-A isoform X2 [Haplochromis burtoni]|uniref:probable serine/threonine-protein kinase MARK-A isoform X2 n=1 Tax=Haplochromis burtoni TaxID=8153 RepID=UPI0003BCEB9D|nr:probable serine/threonine-protein kinase MARK-A isoform X2 [Haplochromis burtoni]